MAGLLQRRPDLAQGRVPAGIAGLAERAQQRSSIEVAIATTTLAENRLLQVVACCRPDVALDELAEALPLGVGLDDIEETLAALEAVALVWCHGGCLHSSATLRKTMPTTLGPPVGQLVEDQTVDYFKSALKVLRADLAAQGFTADVPPRAVGPDGRPPGRLN